MPIGIFYGKVLLKQKHDYQKLLEASFDHSIDRSINYLRSDKMKKMSDEILRWWDGLAEELQTDIELEEKATS
jgi:hypothetical protein